MYLFKCKLKLINLNQFIFSLINYYLYYFLVHCHVIACVKFAFSLTFYSLYISSIFPYVLTRADSSTQEKGSLAYWCIWRVARVTHRQTVEYRSWTASDLVQKRLCHAGRTIPERVDMACQLSYLHSQSNISNPAVSLQFTLYSGCDRQDQSWEDPRFTTSLKWLNPLVVFGLLSLSLCSRSKMTGLQTTAYKSVIMLYYH